MIKHVVGGGPKTAADFQITVTGPTPAPATFPGSEAGTNVVLGGAGAYDVTEGDHTGYTVSYSNDCNGSGIAQGETKTCTVTNTRETGYLKLSKVFDPKTSGFVGSICDQVRLWCW